MSNGYICLYNRFENCWNIKTLSQNQLLSSSSWTQVVTETVSRKLINVWYRNVKYVSSNQDKACKRLQQHGKELLIHYIDVKRWWYSFQNCNGAVRNTQTVIIYSTKEENHTFTFKELLKVHSFYTALVHVSCTANYNLSKQQQSQIMQLFISDHY